MRDRINRFACLLLREKDKLRVDFSPSLRYWIAISEEDNQCVSNDEQDGGNYMAGSGASGVSAIPSHDELAAARPLMTEALFEKTQVKAIADSINEIKEDIIDVKNHRFTDFLWHTGAFIAFGMFVIALYFWVDDKVSAVAAASTRMEAKLEDLLARLPPAPTPPRR